MEAIFGVLWVPCLLCFIVGVVLLVIELCLPGFGVAGCVGTLCFGAVIVMQFMTNNPSTASLVSLVMALIIILLVAMLIRSIQKGLLFRSPIVLKDLVGKTGVVVTPLRPSGTILIDGKRVNVKTQARFIEKDQTVTVIASDGLDWIVE